MPTYQYGSPPRRNYKVAKAIGKRLIRSGMCCPKCKENKKLSLDHIIPVCILIDMGIDVYRDDDNIQVICYDCNKEKRGRLDFADSRTIPLLRRYLDEVETSYPHPSSD